MKTRARKSSKGHMKSFTYYTHSVQAPASQLGSKTKEMVSRQVIARQKSPQIRYNSLPDFLVVFFL